MSETPRLKIGQVAADQSQKHVPVNEALVRLDALVDLNLLDRDLTAPPTASDGDSYLVAASATGAWSGEDGRIAYFIDGGWRFFDPFAGLGACVADESKLIIFDGTQWNDLGSLLDLDNLDKIGVNTTADAVNRLAVKSNAVLFAGLEAAAGGDGDIRFKIVKETVDDTAALLFQTNYSGRAEIGLVGDDDFVFKVSADGTTFREGIRIDRETGAVSFPGGGAREMLAADRTYHVRTDGSDTNSGFSDSPGGAFRTIQHAYDLIAATLDLAGHTITIEVGAGTYTAGLRVDQPWTGGGAVVLRGDVATPANVVLSVATAGADAIGVVAPLPGVLTVEGFRLTTSGSALDLVRLEAPGVVNLGNMDYGPAARFGIHAGTTGAFISVGGTYTVSGDQSIHVIANANSRIGFNAIATAIGAPAFSAGCLYAIRSSLIEVQGGSFSGAATGPRHHADLNGVILLSGLTPFGNAAGTTATGGQVV